MTGRRNTIIAISAIVVFAAIVGFFITLDVSPQIAYARLFIDAGLVIGLIAVVMAFYREKEIPTENIVKALHGLKEGKYKTRIIFESHHPLSDVSASINELALALEDHHAKQEEIKRNLREELLPGFKPKDQLVAELHSVHPELGPVRAIPAFAAPTKIKDSLPTQEPIVTRPPKLSDQRINNTLIESNPPSLESAKELITPDLVRTSQDLGELYQRFVDAQRAINIEQIEYTLFLKTIEKTTEELKTLYRCQGVFFDIANEQGIVALQPKIVR